MNIEALLIAAIRKAAHFNSDVQVAPACILWPDGERQFENVIPQLREAMPELLTLGEYHPELRSGPAIWLRCAVDDHVPDFVPGKNIPVIYLPGVSRSQLRMVEEYPGTLKQLAYYPWRGVFFSQKSGKDWTILAFLKSGDGGLKLDVATDEATHNTMLIAFPLLLEQDVERLRRKHLDKDFFNTLITGGDPVKDILQWLNEGDSWRTKKPELQWNAFVELCKSNYMFNPELDGRSRGLELFANRQGVWQPIFDRYAESYPTYRNIYNALSEVPCPDFELFGNVVLYGGWPQWNENEEKILLRNIEVLSEYPLPKALAMLTEQKQQHTERRSLVWAKIGQSPLAMVIDELLSFAKMTQEGFLYGSVAELTDYYEKQGYKIDLAAWKIIACLKNKTERDTVKKVIRQFYLPWLEATSNRLQKLFGSEGYFASTNIQSKDDSNSCYLFVDGLRLDLATELAEKLCNFGMTVSATARWTPLPSMTANGKPAAVPAKDQLCISESNSDLDPLKAAGIPFAKYLDKQGISADNHINWQEFGDIDHAGHDHGGDMPLHIESIMDALVEKIQELLSGGCSKVRVVTDHGWLYLPGGLPKTDLLVGLTDGKWGRFAILKEGAACSEIQKPWFWNPAVTVTLPPGISSHRANMEYAHGGLSLQECRLLELTVTAKTAKPVLVTIEEYTWKGMRCRYRLNGNFSGCRVDLRLNPTQSDSLLSQNGTVKEDGTGSIILADDSLEGQAAFLVVPDQNNNIATQKLLQIGE